MNDISTLSGLNLLTISLKAHKNVQVAFQNGAYIVRYYETEILRCYPYLVRGYKQVNLNNGGFITPSTVRRMNDALSACEIKASVFIHRKQMYAGVNGLRLPFVDNQVLFNYKEFDS